MACREGDILTHPDGSSEICIGGDWMKLSTKVKPGPGPVTAHLLREPEDLDAVREAMASSQHAVIVQIIDLNVAQATATEQLIEEELEGT